ncbi:MAG: tRNA (guanosine(37)-N1)-methyltransferase TrmD [Deltaproteobacteria bacterium]|nr:tRNA (guanosine(37)-N1)-methyltransferase TrmD [Deltaproteobacteria bacterium]
MQVGILTIFPEIFRGFLESSLVGKAAASGKLEVILSNLRDFADPPHYKVDDTPYGGGAGMVMKPEPIVKGVEAMKVRLPLARTILLSASGRIFNQEKALELSRCEQIIFLCGRYEGIDQRAIDEVVDEEISIGDYVMMGGEIAAMAVIEASLRLVSDVLGNSASITEESFGIKFGGCTLLEGSQYTRPPEFRGRKVPEVLCSGNHERISKWRLDSAIEKTRSHRPDLLKE